MSEEFGFSVPAYRPDDALLQLKRTLRDLKLGERGNSFELRGKRVVELDVDAATIQVRLARRLAAAPEWDRLTLQSSGDQRKLVDEVKKRLERWQRED